MARSRWQWCRSSGISEPITIGESLRVSSAALNQTANCKSTRWRATTRPAAVIRRLRVDGEGTDRWAASAAFHERLFSGYLRVMPEVIVSHVSADRTVMAPSPRGIWRRSAIFMQFLTD